MKTKSHSWERSGRNRETGGPAEAQLSPSRGEKGMSRNMKLLGEVAFFCAE